MRPKVVILSAFLTPFRSGAEACVEEVSRRLRGRYDITIVTCRLRAGLPKEDTLNGIRVIRVGLGLPLDKWLFPLLAPGVVAHLRPDIIHAVLESYAGVALGLCHRWSPQAKRILTCQSTNTTFLMQWIHRAAHRVTVISWALMARARRMHREDALLLPNGIDYSAIRSACDVHPRVRGRLLFAGRLERVKGIDTLLHALALVRDQLRFDVHIAGRGSQRHALEQLAKTLKIDDRVRFLGYLEAPALYREYAEAEIFCGLSRSEALGNVFLEAQAAGCAVVATNVGGIPDSVADGVTGVLVPPDDPQAAAAALRKFHEDHEWMQSLAIEGIVRTRSYDWNEIAEEYDALYASVL